jgi:hypothetical protein
VRAHTAVGAANEADDEGGAVDGVRLVVVGHMADVGAAVEDADDFHSSALENLGFPADYNEAADSVLDECKRAAQIRLKRKNSRLEKCGIPEVAFVSSRNKKSKRNFFFRSSSTRSSSSSSKRSVVC